MWCRLLPLDGNHDVPVFDEVPAGQFRNETPPEPTYRLDAVTENFLGRAVDVQKVCQVEPFRITSFESFAAVV